MGIPLLSLLTVGLLPSSIKKSYYRLRGAKIGKRVHFGLFSVIAAKSIEIGDDCKFGPFSFTSAQTVKLGKRVHIRMLTAIDTRAVEIGDDSIIMEQVVIGGMTTPRSSLSIGKRVRVFPFSFINPTEPIRIEDEVGIGGANYIFTHGSWQSILDGFPVSFGPVTIKKGVWLPWRVFVMPNVTIGEYATLGTGSVVTKDIPGHSLALGMPAKVIKERSQYVKQLSGEERNSIAVKILGEFAEHLNFSGYRASQPEGREPMSIVVEIKRTRRVIEYFESNLHIDPKDKSSILVVLAPIGSQIRDRLITWGGCWFALTNKECLLDRSVECDLLREFLGRYGIWLNAL